MQKKVKGAFVFLLIFNCLISNLNAQQDQTYTGNYTNDEGVVGKATYSYYEKDYVKIKNGPFEYSYNVNGVNRLLKGSFVGGFRDGVWTSFIAGRGLEVTITGAFLSGLPNGKFTYEATYNGAAYQLMTANFTNGMIVGEFSYEDKRKGESAFGMINPDGFMEGEWKIIEGNKEYIQKYENGCFTLYIERNVSDGNVTKKDDYSSRVKDLSSVDILTTNSQWEVSKSDDVYGVYIQKLWSNWDAKSVGGIQENPIKGMYFKKQSAKVSLSDFNLKSVQFYHSIDFNKKDSLMGVFNTMKSYNELINSEAAWFNMKKDNILSKEIILRDSIVKRVNEVLKFQPLYSKVKENYQKLIGQVDLANNQISKLNKLIEDIRTSNYNGKSFSGLIYPSVNQFNLKEFLELKSGIVRTMSAMNYQNANLLMSSYGIYDSLLNEFSKKNASLIASATLEIQTGNYQPSNELFVSSVKSIYESLEAELKANADLNSKLLLVKKGDKIQEKLVLIQDLYYSNLGSEFNLSSLIDYTSKLKRLRLKLEELMNSEEGIPTLAKEIKNVEDLAQVEALLLK